MPVANRRQEHRFDLRVPAHISMPKRTHPEKELFLVTVNVCSKGAFFESPECLPVGTEVKVELRFPPKTADGAGFLVGEVTVAGRVVRSSGDGIAISFSDKFRMSTKRIGFENN